MPARAGAGEVDREYAAGGVIERQRERGLDGTFVLNRGSGAGRIRMRGAKR